MRTFEGHSSLVNTVTLSLDGTRVLSGSLDKTLKLWDTQAGTLVRTFEGHSDSVNAVALSQDGTRALSSSSDKTLKLWDTHTGRLLMTFTADWSIYGCALSSSHEPMVCAGDQSGRVHLLRLLPGHPAPHRQTRGTPTKQR